MFDFVNFIRQKFSEYSDASGQKGTVVDSLAVQPSALVLTDFYNSLVDQRRINDISQWATMTDDELDRFGNKFFLPRVQGEIASGNIRIYFDAKYDIDISTDIRARSSSGLLYQAVMPSVISGNSFKASNDSSAKYYVDVQFSAVSGGSNYNLVAGDITSLVNATFIYKKVTNPEDITGGTTREENVDYYKRLIYSTNDRSMMNKRSTIALLKGFFPYINSMYIAAPGDKYMTRDLIQAIDTSVPIKSASFLGKIPSNNTVNNSAFYGIFPPEAGTTPASFAGPLSIYSNYKYPLTIDPVNLLSMDPAFHGYPLSQEATAEMYQGLYFNDYKNFMSISTSDLFNIYDENIGLSDVITPNADWVIGANGLGNGDYGVLPSGVSKSDIVKFNNNEITMSAGSDQVISVSKDISKRLGIKLTGKFTTPTWNATNANSGLQFMIGGYDDVGKVDAFTGVGFGFRINSNINTGVTTEMNASVYFAHSEQVPNGAQIFASSDNFTTTAAGWVSVAGMNALAEKTARLTPGAQYEFEFALTDALGLSLYIKKVGTESYSDDQFGSWVLPDSVLNVFAQELKAINSTHYGTMMKTTLNTESVTSTDAWVIADLKAVDLVQHRANALFIFDANELESPLSINFRGSALSYFDNISSNGFSIYIWDTEKASFSSGSSLLTLGGWTELQDISNPDGIKDSISVNLTQELTSLDSYKISSRYGESIILLITTTGTSNTSLKSKGDFIDDVKSSLQVDYIDIKNSPIDLYHGNNKADIYVSTLKNTEVPTLITNTIVKGSGDSYFIVDSSTGFTTPIFLINSISINTGGVLQTLSQSDYKIIRSDTTNLNSDKETIYISLNNNYADTITVEYSSYQDISNIQSFYDDSQYSKLLGNILVKHKFPCYLDLSLLYTGSTSPDDLITAVKQYFDVNIDDIFSIQDLISYLYNQNLINNIQQPISISYSKYDDNLNVITGQFTDSLTIRQIDFFRINNISASKL